MKKKIISSILSLIMLLSLLPVSAFATENYEAGKIYTATLHDTRNESSNTDKANAIADTDLITGYSVVESEPSSSSVKDVDKVITLSGTNLKYHRNGNTPADMGYWIGVAFTAPEGAEKYKMASSNTANNEALPDAFLNRFTNATEEIVRENIKGDQDGCVQYFDLTAIPASNHLYIKLQWLDGSGNALKASNGQEIGPVVYEIVRDVTLSKPTLTVTASTGTVLGKSVNDIQSNVSATQANANGKITVTGTSKYASWDAFSSNTDEKEGNYIALELEAKRDGTTVYDDIWFRTDIPQAWTQLSEADHTIALILKDNGSRNVDVVISGKQPSADATPDFKIDLVGVTRSPASTNATISTVSIEDAAIALPETTSSNATAPAEIKATFAANSEAVLNNLDVALTVDPTSTVKTVAGDDGTPPANEAAYNVDQTVDTTTGAVSISTVNLTPATAGNPGSPAKALYIMVTAQDGTTKAFYKIIAEKSEIAVASVAPTVPNVEAVPEGDQSAVATAGAATTVSSGDADTLRADALAKAEADATVTQASAKKALEDSTDVDFDESEGDTATIYVVPSVKVEVTEYETTADGSEVTAYTVDIKLVATVYATTADVGSGDNPVLPGAGAGTVNSVFMKEIELKTPGTISVDIGVPTKLANDGEKVYVVHKTDRFLETVGNNKVTVDVSSFSPFTLTKATDAVLSGITLSDGTLSPAFAADTTSYTARVANNVSAITVTPVVADGLSTTVKKDATIQSGPISLDVGENTITIEVTGTGLTTTTYTLTVTRAADDSGNGGGNGGGGGGAASSVTVGRPTNGKVNISPTAPSKGATVTINLTPDTGYEVGSVTVKDADGNTVDVVKVNDTQYTFVMPDGKVSVDATFTQVQQPSDEPFVDISKSDYFYDAVLWAVEKGITTGDGVNTFGPNKSCTRAQMVTFLWRAAGSPAPTGTNSFNDVAAGEYYTDAVLWAVEKGITNGTGIGTFSPNDTVTRGQTVTFLYRYAGSPAVSGGESFGDVASTDYFADAVQWAVANGITYGDGVDTFSPAKDCTRGQIVTFMYRQMAE